MRRRYKFFYLSLQLGGGLLFGHGRRPSGGPVKPVAAVSRAVPARFLLRPAGRGSTRHMRRRALAGLATGGTLHVLLKRMQRQTVACSSCHRSLNVETGIETSCPAVWNLVFLNPSSSCFRLAAAQFRHLPGSHLMARNASLICTRCVSRRSRSI